MAQVVHATCPCCSSPLRIPGEWAARTLRCRFCKSIFQGQPRCAEPTLTGIIAVPVAGNGAAHAPARPADAFDFNGNSADGPALRVRRRRFPIGLVLLALVGIGALAV